MPAPAIFRSKAFWGFSTVTLGISSAVGYDRFQAHELTKKYLQEASLHGQQPLYPGQQPRCLSLFLLSPTLTHHSSLRSAFKSFAVELLTRAGIDYKWVVEVDGEEAKVLWDQLARDANKPELMLDTSAIDPEQLRTHILNFVLDRKPTVAEVDNSTCSFLWDGLRSKYAVNPSLSSDFVSLDPFTAESLETHLKALSQSTPPISQSKPVKSSWFSKSPPTQTPTIPHLFPVNLYTLPCDHSQSPLARLRRFLFGQHEMTRLIGEAVLKIINEHPETQINKQ